MVAEKTKIDHRYKKSTVIVVLTLIAILCGIIIAIPIVYSVGRDPGTTTNFNVPSNYTDNECTAPSTNTTVLEYLINEEPFPYMIRSYMYRPSVILTSVYLIFGFRHDTSQWALDKITVNDTTTSDNIILDGDFESNYLLLHYQYCILSNTRNANPQILFDIPYSGDFYYNDQTVNGMTYISQQLNVIGGRYYNISFYLENRGFANPTNNFLLMIGYGS